MSHGEQPLVAGAIKYNILKRLGGGKKKIMEGTLPRYKAVGLHGSKCRP
jgi:hypothetical protein